MSSQRARYLRRATPRLGSRRPCPNCDAWRKVIQVDVSTPDNPHATVDGLAPCPCLPPGGFTAYPNWVTLTALPPRRPWWRRVRV